MMSNTQGMADRVATKEYGKTRIDLPSVMAIPPRAGKLLLKLTQTADFETALWKLLTDYTEMKIKALHEQIQALEAKWGMTFATFAEQCAAGTLPTDAYTYEVESDFWDWEQATTLLAYYEALQSA